MSKQLLNFQPNFFKGRLYLRGKLKHSRQVDFPKTHVKDLEFFEIPQAVTIQNASQTTLGYLKATVSNGNKSLVSKTLLLRGGQKRNFSDFGRIPVNKEADGVRFSAIGKTDFIITLDESAAFTVVEDLPEADLRVDDIRSTSMSISWNGEKFPETLFKVVLTSPQDTKEYTTSKSILHATGLRDDTAYKVQLFKVDK